MWNFQFLGHQQQYVYLSLIIPKKNSQYKSWANHIDWLQSFWITSNYAVWCWISSKVSGEISRCLHIYVSFAGFAHKTTYCSMCIGFTLLRCFSSSLYQCRCGWILQALAFILFLLISHHHVHWLSFFVTLCSSNIKRCLLLIRAA